MIENIFYEIMFEKIYICCKILVYIFKKYSKDKFNKYKNNYFKIN